jgi:hypothetical protein
MLDLKSIERTLNKLKRSNVKGEENLGHIELDDKGRKEIRYSYYFQGKQIFTFGISRGTATKSKKFRYVPRQMGLQNQEYKLLHDCPWSKSDYNNKLGLRIN